MNGKKSIFEQMLQLGNQLKTTELYLIYAALLFIGAEINQNFQQCLLFHMRAAAILP